MGVGCGLLCVVGRMADWVFCLGLLVGLFRADRRTFAELFSGTIVLRRSTMPTLEYKPPQYVRDSRHYS